MSTRYFAGTLTLLAVALLLCIGATFSMLEPGSQHAGWIFEVGTVLLWLAGILAIGSLYRSGGFRHSRMGRLFLVLISCFLVFAVARIQHWSWAQAIAPVPFFGTVAVYGVWFLKKTAKQPADFLKMAWVALACGGSGIAVMRTSILLPDWWPVVGILLLFAAYITTYIERRRKRQVPAPAGPEPWTPDLKQ